MNKNTNKDQPAPDSVELRKKVKAAFHQIRTRALRDAPVYLQHVTAAEEDIMQLFATHQPKAPVGGEPTRIDLAFDGVPHWFFISWFDTEDELRADLKRNGVFDFEGDTIAYTDTWSNDESLENGLGDISCAGGMYLLRDATPDTLAHEAVHMALGILSRHGNNVVPITTDKAPKIEEQLCSVVGFITDALVAALQNPTKEKS